MGLIVRWPDHDEIFDKGEHLANNRPTFVLRKSGKILASIKFKSLSHGKGGWEYKRHGDHKTTELVGAARSGSSFPPQLGWKCDGAEVPIRVINEQGASESGLNGGPVGEEGREGSNSKPIWDGRNKDDLDVVFGDPDDTSRGEAHVTTPKDYVDDTDMFDVPTDALTMPNPRKSPQRDLSTELGGVRKRKRVVAARANGISDGLDLLEIGALAFTLRMPRPYHDAVYVLSGEKNGRKCFQQVSDSRFTIYFEDGWWRRVFSDHPGSNGDVKHQIKDAPENDKPGPPNTNKWIVTWKRGGLIGSKWISGLKVEYPEDEEVDELPAADSESPEKKSRSDSTLESLLATKGTNNAASTTVGVAGMSQPIAPRRYCAVCKSEANYACGDCDQVAYCSQEHQLEHWTSGGHSKQCKKLAMNATKPDLESKKDPNSQVASSMLPTPITPMRSFSLRQCNKDICVGTKGRVIMDRDWNKADERSDLVLFTMHFESGKKRKNSAVFAASRVNVDGKPAYYAVGYPNHVVFFENGFWVYATEYGGFRLLKAPCGKHQDWPPQRRVWLHYASGTPHSGTHVLHSVKLKILEKQKAKDDKKSKLISESNSSAPDPAQSIDTSNVTFAQILNQDAQDAEVGTEVGATFVTLAPSSDEVPSENQHIDRATRTPSPGPAQPSERIVLTFGAEDVSSDEEIELNGGADNIPSALESAIGTQLSLLRRSFEAGEREVGTSATVPSFRKHVARQSDTARPPARRVTAPQQRAPDVNSKRAPVPKLEENPEYLKLKAAAAELELRRLQAKYAEKEQRVKLLAMKKKSVTSVDDKRQGNAVEANSTAVHGVSTDVEIASQPTKIDQRSHEENLSAITSDHQYSQATESRPDFGRASSPDAKKCAALNSDYRDSQLAESQPACSGDPKNKKNSAALEMRLAILQNKAGNLRPLIERKRSRQAELLDKAASLRRELELCTAEADEFSLAIAADIASLKICEVQIAELRSRAGPGQKLSPYPTSSPPEKLNHHDTILTGTLMSLEDATPLEDESVDDSGCALRQTSLELSSMQDSENHAAATEKVGAVESIDEPQQSVKTDRLPIERRRLNHRTALAPVILHSSILLRRLYWDEPRSITVADNRQKQHRPTKVEMDHPSSVLDMFYTSGDKTKMDSHKVLCRYALRGTCRDPNCEYQHFNRDKVPSTIVPLRTDLDVPASTSSPVDDADDTLFQHMFPGLAVRHEPTTRYFSSLDKQDGAVSEKLHEIHRELDMVHVETPKDEGSWITHIRQRFKGVSFADGGSVVRQECLHLLSAALEEIPDSKALWVMYLRSIIECGDIKIADKVRLAEEASARAPSMAIWLIYFNFPMPLSQKFDVWLRAMEWVCCQPENNAEEQRPKRTKGNHVAELVLQAVACELKCGRDLNTVLTTFDCLLKATDGLESSLDFRARIQACTHATREEGADGHWDVVFGCLRPYLDALQIATLWICRLHLGLTGTLPTSGTGNVSNVVPLHLHWIQSHDPTGAVVEEVIFWHGFWAQYQSRGDLVGPSAERVEWLRKEAATGITDIIMECAKETGLAGGFESSTTSGVMSLLAWVALMLQTILRDENVGATIHIVDLLGSRPSGVDDDLAASMDRVTEAFLRRFSPNLHSIAAEMCVVPLNDLFLRNPLGDPFDTVDWETARTEWTRCMGHQYLHSMFRLFEDRGESMLQMSILASVVWDEYFGCYSNETLAKSQIQVAETFCELEELSMLWCSDRDSESMETDSSTSVFSEGSVTLERALQQMSLLARKMIGLTDPQLAECPMRRSLPAFRCRCCGGAKGDSFCMPLLHLIIKGVAVSNNDEETCAAYEFALREAQYLNDVGSDLWISYLTFRFGDEEDELTMAEWVELKSLAFRGITWTSKVAKLRPLSSVLTVAEIAALGACTLGPTNHALYTPILEFLFRRGPPRFSATLVGELWALLPMHQGLVLRAVEIARKSYASTIASDIIATSISWSPLAEAYWLLAADIEQQQDNISEARWLCNEALKYLPTSKILYDYAMALELKSSSSDARLRTLASEEIAMTTLT